MNGFERLIEVFIINKKNVTISVPEVFSEPFQTSKIDGFAKIVNGFQPLTIFAKDCILDV